MDTVFLVEDLFLQSVKRIKKEKCTRLDRIHRGYFASLSDAENAIKAQASYFMPKRLGFYVKEYQLNPKPETSNSQVRQYSYSADGESITAYQFYDCFHSHFEGTDTNWKEGDMVLFEEEGHIWTGRIVKVPHTKQWFIEHAEYVEQFYNRLNRGELNEKEDDMELDDVYYISTLKGMSISIVKSANIFYTLTFSMFPAILIRFPSTIN